jgi:hypothetical protein
LRQSSNREIVIARSDATKQSQDDTRIEHEGDPEGVTIGHVRQNPDQATAGRQHADLTIPLWVGAKGLWYFFGKE